MENMAHTAASTANNLTLAEWFRRIAILCIETFLDRKTIEESSIFPIRICIHSKSILLINICTHSKNNILLKKHLSLFQKRRCV